MIYNKKGRIVQQKSPADTQKSNDMISPLLSRIEELTIENSDLKSAKTSAGMYSEDELNDIVNTEVIKALESNGVVSPELSQLKEKIISLQELIKTKDEVISILKADRNNADVVGVTANRPTIDDNIVDPSEDIDIKAHITVREDISTVDMSDKLSKLKIALGGQDASRV
jgi:hypothetical protein